MHDRKTDTGDHVFFVFESFHLGFSFKGSSVEETLKYVYLLTIENHNKIARYNLIYTKYRQMALWLVPNNDLLEPLVKQKRVVTARGRQPMKFVVMSLNTANLIFFSLSLCVYLYKNRTSQFFSHWKSAEPVFCSEDPLQKPKQKPASQLFGGKIQICCMLRT